jgi:hypothetical protein
MVVLLNLAVGIDEAGLLISLVGDHWYNCVPDALNRIDSPKQMESGKEAFTCEG